MRRYSGREFVKLTAEPGFALFVLVAPTDVTDIDEIDATEAIEAEYRDTESLESLATETDDYKKAVHVWLPQVLGAETYLRNAGRQRVRLKWQV